MRKNVCFPSLPMKYYHGSDAYASDTSLGCNDECPWNKQSSSAINGCDNTGSFALLLLAVAWRKT
jgi:hypothetical protein